MRSSLPGSSWRPTHQGPRRPQAAAASRAVDVPVGVAVVRAVVSAGELIAARAVLGSPYGRIVACQELVVAVRALLVPFICCLAGL